MDSTEPLPESKGRVHLTLQFVQLTSYLQMLHMQHRYEQDNEHLCPVASTPRVLHNVDDVDDLH
jgi:hypothetical protein